MTPQELEIARSVLAALRSDAYKSWNYLFLQPFDVSQTPGYLDVVERQLDVQTVSNLLEAGTYATLEEFWKDTSDIFENAIKYHSDKETKWVAKLAKEMLKAVNKERKKKEGAGAKSQKKKIKLQRPATASAEGSAAELPQGSALKKMPSLKLKLPTQQKSKANQAVKAKPTQPKLKLKLTLNKPHAPIIVTSAATAPASTSAGVARPSELGPPVTVPSGTEKPKSTASKPKISLKLGNNRGKELPIGVNTPAPPSKKPPNAVVPLSTKAPVPAGAPGSVAGAAKPKKPKKAVGKGSFPVAQASKVLAGLRRRQSKSIGWFLQPVSDKIILADYKAKIKHAMDISTMTNKLEKYSSVNAFVLDLRRIFANALIYNTSIKDSLRPVAVEVLQTAEELLKVFFAGQSYPPLLYCWKLCVGVLDTLYNLVNPTDGQPTALYFLHPVSYYCGGQFPPDYLEKIPKPMDFGTVTSSLLEGRYSTVEMFCSDCQLVISNCINYYSGREDGRIYVDQANRLNEVLAQQVEQLGRYVRSSRGSADQAKVLLPVVLSVPPQATLLSVLEDLRTLNYTDKATKITEAAMGPFEKPVSLQVFPDYPQYVQQPMDLHTVERKVRSGVYVTAEDFEYDVSLVFKNCEVYHSKRNGDHFVAMAKFGARQFRRSFYAKMRAFEDPSSVPQPKVEPDISSSAEATGRETPSPQKIKLLTGSAMGKAAPRISITASQVTSASLSAARSKSPAVTQKRNTPNQPPPKSNLPVPLHIAIARVKEAFPLRRALKSLQTWEADCARYFKELMRHPWISAARPKFIFHVPVPTLFPELRDVYASKVKKPMDLTTVECSLLAGNRYAGPEDFIQDVALVFANAIRFNKDGRDIGDPLSCAYYDASVHLLRYSRWLSLEFLMPFVVSIDHIDEPGADGLPPFSWKLTEGNKRKAREEMEKLVLNEPIDKSLEGDRWTWHEAECEKLLKALRHQSDLRYMTFFIQPNYPADYTAFISKPMDWEKVQRTLKKRQYDKFGDVIDDLRLIFSNALKYNARLKGTDTVSGRAYDAATYMSGKMEAAINKLMLSVSDRIERERIDHSNAEREIEAEDRAEEARIRAAWKKEPDAEGVSQTLVPRTDVAQKIRLVRRATYRRETTDFEIPFFDEEDDGQHESSYFEVVKSQKSMFEKQRQELTKMRHTALQLGAAVYSKLLQRSLALAWVETESKKNAAGNVGEAIKDGDKPEPRGQDANKPSAILNDLTRPGREPLKLKLPQAKSKPKKRKRNALLLE